MSRLLELRGVVEAAPDAVAEVLLDVRPGGRSPIVTHGDADTDGDEFVVTKDGSRISVVVDRSRRSVSMQGEWWYRGVTEVRPDPRGSLVVHQIYDIAARGKWAVRFVSRGPVNAAHDEFRTQLEHLGRELGVSAWLED